MRTLVIAAGARRCLSRLGFWYACGLVRVSVSPDTSPSIGWGVGLVVLRFGLGSRVARFQARPRWFSSSPAFRSPGPSLIHLTLARHATSNPCLGDPFRGPDAMMRAAFNAQVGYRDILVHGMRFLRFALASRSTAVAVAFHSKQGLTGQGSDAPAQFSGCACRTRLRGRCAAPMRVGLDPPIQLSTFDPNEARRRPEDPKFPVFDPGFEKPTSAADLFGGFVERKECPLNGVRVRCVVHNERIVFDVAFPLKQRSA